MQKLVLLLLICVLGGVALAVKFLAWWVVVLGALVSVLGGKFLVKRLLARAILTPFKMKGAVLKGASTQLHSVAPSNPPDSTDQAITPAAPLRYFLVDLTIQPAPAAGPFGCWEPGELTLVKPDSTLNPNNSDADQPEDTCAIERIEVHENGQFKEDQGFKYEGPQRLRLLLAVKAGVTQLKFRYYFEEFGQVNLPAPAVPRAA